MKILRISCVFLSLVVSLSGQTLTTLHNFDGTDGANPYPVLVQATNGDLYGTTLAGGAYGNGTVFKITPGGTLTTLYSFCSQPNCTDGALSATGLVQATNGNFYGATQVGGSFGHGSIFKITPSGTLTILHSFDGTDGSLPYEALVQAFSGDLYGGTYEGGTRGDCDPLGCGTIFKITPDGTLTTLDNFDGTDGEYPSVLVQAANGELYGTTLYGGANRGDGMVFKITQSGTLTTLYSFCSQPNCTDGAFPTTGLVQATNGNFYGTTGSGGAYGNGTIFKINTGGTLSTLYNFCAQVDCPDGFGTTGVLIQATNRNFYGTTEAGGINDNGTVFEITPGGTLATLHRFDGTDGSGPTGVVQDTNGDFYGTTAGGGANSVGTIFRLSMGLGPFVETQPTSGKVGAAVKILGTDLTGATSVTFNGMTAKFTVVSKSEIKTTVPEDATTGKIEVKTPSGTLKSNVVFRVTK
jgi:uncharacterized repeat protein (TIGR03803 family)